MEPTLEFAYAVGQDAGNKSMRANERTSWNEDDWNAAADATQLLLSLLPDPE